MNTYKVAGAHSAVQAERAAAGAVSRMISTFSPRFRALLKRNRSTWDNVSIELSDRVDLSPNGAIYDRRRQALLPREVVGALASAAELQTTSRVLVGGSDRNGET